MGENEENSLLGSTGSIGTQALDIISKNRDKFTVKALTCGKRVEVLTKQIEAFNPDLVCEEERDAIKLKNAFEIGSFVG